ncbi:MAG: hypothetical protein CW338_01530 [Clostridiales bacterium]|nr:hypothetical protein [Clostridiales bacterium]
MPVQAEKNRKKRKTGKEKNRKRKTQKDRTARSIAQSGAFFARRKSRGSPARSSDKRRTGKNMFTTYTLQDLEAAKAGGALEEFLMKCVEAYRQSPDFARAAEAAEYFRGHNRAILNKYLLQTEIVTVTDERGRTRRVSRPVRVQGNRLPCGFFRRAVMQLNQYLLSGGVYLKDAAVKRRLGTGFDKALEQLGECALVQGVSWGFFNCDHLEVMQAAEGTLSGFVPLYDEVTGEPGSGIRFWQLDEDRPLRLRLFEADGVSSWERERGGGLRQVSASPYLTEGGAPMKWKRLPVIPLYANNEKRSELTETVKRKIDAYDNILSDLGNNLDRANEVYWVLNNFGGDAKQALEVLEQIRELKMVINSSDGSGAGGTADMKTAEVPYLARKAALDILRREMYADFMALDMETLTGGSLTNVAIKAAMADLDLKANSFEWQCFRFVQSVLELLGVTDEDISFRRQSISNAHETVEDIYRMRADLDRRSALMLNPYIDQDEAERLISSADASPAE